MVLAAPLLPLLPLLRGCRVGLCLWLVLLAVGPSVATDVLVQWSDGKTGSPVMLSQPTPVFAWSLASGFNGSDAQTAFEFELHGPSFDFEPGWMNVSDQHYRYAGPALPPRQRLWWRVRVASASSGLSSWTAPLTVFTPLWGTEQAVPVWAPRNSSGALPSFVLLRGELVVHGVADSALLYITAQGPASLKSDFGCQKLLGAYKVVQRILLVSVGHHFPSLPPSLASPSFWLVAL